MSMAGTSSTVETQSNAAALLVGDLAWVTWLVRELAKRVPFHSDDRGHSMFQERIIGNPQKSQARMMRQALFLPDKAKAGNKPQLQIFADDVTCGHATTSGALDDSLLFYLRARGLPEKEAQALQIQAFGSQAIEGIADAGLREFVSAQVAPWLETRR
jgi:Fe-S cluster assembly protein SufD